MKVCKKYEELVLMYKFNPIVVDELLIELFHNIQTLHIYTPNCVLDIDAYRNRLIAERDNLRRMIAEENNQIIEEIRRSLPTQDVLLQTLVNEREQLQQGLNNIRSLRNRRMVAEENNLSNRIAQIENAIYNFIMQDAFYQRTSSIKRKLDNIWNSKNRIQQIEKLLSILPEDFFQIVLWPGCHVLPINHANIDYRHKDARIFFNNIEVLSDENDEMYPLTMHVPSQERKNITNVVGLGEPKILVQVPSVDRNNVKIYLDVCIEFIEPKAFYLLKNCCVLIIVPSREKFEALKGQLLFAISTDNTDQNVNFAIKDLKGNTLW